MLRTAPAWPGRPVTGTSRRAAAHTDSNRDRRLIQPHSRGRGARVLSAQAQLLRQPAARPPRWRLPHLETGFKPCGTALKSALLPMRPPVPRVKGRNHWAIGARRVDRGVVSQRTAGYAMWLVRVTPAGGGCLGGGRCGRGAAKRRTAATSAMRTRTLPAAARPLLAASTRPPRPEDRPVSVDVAFARAGGCVHLRCGASAASRVARAGHVCAKKGAGRGASCTANLGCCCIGS